MHVKIKATPGIYLVGFMGCGKSTVGKLLAERLRWDFIDLDEQIEQIAGDKIANIFQNFGEPAFRAMEHQALSQQVKHIRMGHARIIALGGGAFVQQNNRWRIEDAGASIWLDAAADQLWERVSETDERPLARDRETFQNLWNERRPLYETCDFRIDAEQPPEVVVEEILKLGLL